MPGALIAAHLRANKYPEFPEKCREYRASFPLAKCVGTSGRCASNRSWITKERYYWYLPEAVGIGHLFRKGPLQPIDQPGLTLVPDRTRPAAAAPAVVLGPEQFPIYPNEVCLAILVIQGLSPAHRRLLAHATDLIDGHADMQAQVDAVAG